MKKRGRAATPGSSKRGSKKEAAGKALTVQASPAAAVDPLAAETEMAVALRAASYSYEETSAALVAPGVYPNLTALQLGKVFLSPLVAPGYNWTALSNVLTKAAKFSQADINAALASLFPERVPIKDGAMLTLKFPGRPATPDRVWLAGRFADGTVALSPTATGSGAKWKAHFKGDGVYTFECLGGASPGWLDGDTGGGIVKLAPETTTPYSGTFWEVSKRGNNSYWLKCRGHNANPQHKWLASGQAAADKVGLAPEPTGGLDVNAVAHVSYQAYVSGAGWTTAVSDGCTLGRPDASLQLEAVTIRIAGRGVTYQAHVANVGWMAEVSDGAEAGTTGRRLKLLALKIRTEDTTPQGFTATPGRSPPRKTGRATPLDEVPVRLFKPRGRPRWRRWAG